MNPLLDTLPGIGKRLGDIVARRKSSIELAANTDQATPKIAEAKFA